MSAEPIERVMPETYNPLQIAAWTPKSNCKDLNPELFFPPESQISPVQEVKNRCDACKVKVECLGYALIVKEQGVWGGTTEHQRQQLKRNIRRLRCPDCNSTRVAPIEGQMQVCLSCATSWVAR